MVVEQSTVSLSRPSRTLLLLVPVLIAATAAGLGAVVYRIDNRLHSIDNTAVRLQPVAKVRVKNVPWRPAPTGPTR